jgi:hypothetical protein
MARLPNLQFTTDYDLAVAPPVAAPSALLFGYHTEYVAPSMRDWVRGHLATGRMSLAIFGANSFYWRVRLQAAPGPGLPDELACYKIHPSADPLSATAPTGLYRNLGEPEGAWLGSQYVGVVFDGRRRVSAALTGAVPPALLEGTGWGPGTVLRGFVRGEADAAYLPGPGGAAPGGTATLSRSAGVVDEHGIPIQPAMTATVTPSGARVFDAGTFAFAEFLAPAKVDLGVRHGSFDRFARNVLTWLGLRVH